MVRTGLTALWETPGSSAVQEISQVNARITPVSGIYSWSGTARTARMGCRGVPTWETRTLEYEMSQLPAREVNGQYVVSITSPLPVKLSIRITAGVVLTCRRVYL